MDTILQELLQEILRRTKPGISTPILSSLIDDTLFRRLVSENYKLEYGSDVMTMYKKEGDKWVILKGFKTQIS